MFKNNKNAFTLIEILVVIAILAKDILSDQKQIADLVLIVGYTKESKRFLNEVTASLNRLMQVKAGVERVVSVSEGDIRSIV